MTGRSQIWDGAQWINLSNNPGSKGDTGDTGPPGTGGDVSSDAGNQAILGTDSLVYVPEFADGVYLKLTGGSLSGAVLFPDGSAALPSVSMVNNTSMGMYRAGLNRLGFSVIGSARLELNASSGVPSIGSPVSGGTSAAAFGFTSNTLGFGMYRIAEDRLGFTIGNALRLELSTTAAIFGAGETGRAFISNLTPIQGSPTYAFVGDTPTGMYRFQGNEIAFSLGGVREFTFGANNFNALPVYNRTTAGTANIIINSAGLMERLTSALKYKDDVTDAAYLKDIDLLPVKFHRNDTDRYFYGMIADPLGAQDSLLGVYEDQKEQVLQTTESGEDYFIDGAWKDKGEWEIENYDTLAVIAVMAAKINDQEERLAALESP